MPTAHSGNEVYFQRSSLKLVESKSGWKYDPNNARQFYETCFVEHVSNQVVDADRGHDFTRKHPRSMYKSFKVHHRQLGVFDSMFVTLGDAEAPNRRQRVPLDTTPATYGDRLDKGAHAHVNVVPVLMPNKEEKWMWLDMVTPICAVYFPVVQRSDDDYQQLSTFIQIKFNKPVLVWRPYSHTFGIHPSTPEKGLDNRWLGHTIGINVKGIYDILCLPRQLRDTNIYESKLVVIVTSTHINTRSHYEAQPNVHHSLKHFVSANYDVELKWRPYEFSYFALHQIKVMVQTGLSLLPLAGSLTSFAFGLGMMLFLDENNFREDAMWHGMDHRYINMLISSAHDTAPYLPTEFKKHLSRPIGRAAMPAGGHDNWGFQSMEDLEADRKLKSLDGVKPALTLP